MSDDRENIVDAARERIERHREELAPFAEPAGIRATLLDNLEMVLWGLLVFGAISALMSMISLKLVTAVTTLLTTLATVGIGFAVLDIRARLRRD